MLESLKNRILERRNLPETHAQKPIFEMLSSLSSRPKFISKSPIIGRGNIFCKNHTISEEQVNSDFAKAAKGF